MKYLITTLKVIGKVCNRRSEECKSGPSVSRWESKGFIHRCRFLFVAQHLRRALNCDGEFYITTDPCVLGKMGGCWRWCHQTCTCCLSEDERKSISIDKEIRRILAEQKKKERREIKVLLLGKEEPTTNYSFYT